MATFNGIFSQFLGFIIPLLILGFVAPAIADIGSSAGKMLVVTALIAYVMTLLSGLFSYSVGSWLFPSLITPGSMSGTDLDSSSVAPWFSVDIPPVFSVMTALVLAFVAGLGIAYTRSATLLKGFNEFRDIITLVINGVIIPLLPIYIFGIFMNMTVEGKVGTVITTFISIIIVIFVLHILLLVGQFAIAGIVTRRNPFPLLRTMLPAYFTALGTQSSAATIPVTLRQSIATGVRPSIAGFVIPLCATIHMSGSTLKIVACALALMIMQGIPYTTPMFIGFIAMLGITIVAAPGVPGGAIMASLGLLSSMLGFSEADNALMIALYIAMDSFGTACNVTGDGAISLIIDRIFGREADAKDAQPQP
jgi:Na+/H+-dicarboxylate symporter